MAPTPRAPAHPLDVVPPARIAQLVERIGVAKAQMALAPLFTLAVLAGAFIGFGAMLYTVVITDSALGAGPTKLIGGAAFALGLVLVVVGGAELFTGNALLVIAWADGAIGGWALARNWGVAYLGNLVGALGLVGLVQAAGVYEPSALGETVRAIAQAKTALDPGEAFFRGVLCNVLVCLAVWTSFAARSAVGKATLVAFPVAAFVALGFEHSVANMFLIPIGALQPESGVDGAAWLRNLAPVTLGNIVGGGGLVALVYWLVYRRSVQGSSAQEAADPMGGRGGA